MLATFLLCLGYEDKRLLLMLLKEAVQVISCVAGAKSPLMHSKVASLPKTFRTTVWAMLTRTMPVGRDLNTWTLQEVSLRTTQGLMLLLKQLLLLQLLHWSSEDLTLPSPSFSTRLLLG